jgi:hypothetical protein
MKKLIILTLGILANGGCFAQSPQSHFKGIQGISAEFGVDTKLSQYTLGYHRFLGRNVNIEFNAQYERGKYHNSFGLNYYNVNASYTLENVWLNGTVNFTFFNLGNRIFLDLGVGPTLGNRFIKKVDEYNYAIDATRLEQYKGDNQDKELLPEPVLNAGTLRDRWLIGLNAPITLEIYLSRHFSILARYRAKYLFRASTEKIIYDGTVGASIHF